MLAGLKAISRTLQNNTVVQLEKAYQTTASGKADSRSSLRSRLSPQTPMPGLFSKDYHGNIFDPKGEILFTAASDAIDIGEDGAIYRSGAPMGKIQMFDEDNHMFITAEKEISVRLGISQFISSDKATENFLAMRAFQASLKAVATYQEMTGTIINLVN